MGYGVWGIGFRFQTPCPIPDTLVHSDQRLLPGHGNPVRKPFDVAQHAILRETRIVDAVTLSRIQHQFRRRLSDALHRFIELDALLRRDTSVGFP